MTDMANPETTTPSVEGDRLEAIARLVDPKAIPPHARTGLRGSVALASDQKWQAALAKARQIAALPCKGGDVRLLEQAHRAWTTSEADGNDLFNAIDCFLHPATPTTEPDTGRGLREALRPFAEAADVYGPNDKDETPAHGRGRIKVRHLRAARQALAALSDTPRGREG